MRSLFIGMLLVVSASGAACSGETCEDLDCATLSGDATKAGTHVTVCKRPRGCDGCYYQKVVNDEGDKVDECQDSSVTSACDSFIQRSAKDICTIGALCKRTGNACGKSNTAMSFCCSGWCGPNGTCEPK